MKDEVIERDLNYVLTGSRKSHGIFLQSKKRRRMRLQQMNMNCVWTAECIVGMMICVMGF